MKRFGKQLAKSLSCAKSEASDMEIGGMLKVVADHIIFIVKQSEELQGGHLSHCLLLLLRQAPLPLQAHVMGPTFCAKCKRQRPHHAREETN